MLDVSFKIEGGGELVRKINDIDVRLKDLEPRLTKAIEIVYQRTQQIFKDEGSSNAGKKRSPLKASTVKARENRRGYYRNTPSDPRLLRRTGNLQGNTTKEVTRNKAQLTFNAPYARYHQFGKGRLKRVIAQLDPKTNLEITRALLTYINSKYGISQLRK